MVRRIKAPLGAQPGASASKGRWISKKDYKIFKQLYSSYDKDDSGSVTYQEFIKGFSDYAAAGCVLPSVAGIFQQLDNDHDGEMSFRELLAAYYPFCSKQEIEKFITKYDPPPAKKQEEVARELTAEQEEELEGVLRLFDRNTDGVVDAKELAFYCVNLGIEDENIAAWFEEFDTDHNGTLDMGEFKEFFRQEWTVATTPTHRPPTISSSI
eukprot:TRINITY_DN832_c0_g1_i14.p1 TRINITY_DN832_c0_g1~~TRINITY_DN832_c0_g1_i14.p1  ORF type:complete len:211 (-),score=75.01 TRINITY_DN832_c0_g1_i14:397-1029(-)